VYGDSLTADQRPVLDKFQPLRVGGKTLTSVAIGGYTLDIEKAVEKARRVIPLPPARLPMIFSNPDLNFNHHFFQGLERLIGRDVLLSVVKKDQIESSPQPIVRSFIEDMLEVGYETSDNDLMIFTKTVLTSTFEAGDRYQGKKENRVLTVAANLYGFQYIESQMECDEANLQMWLKICYSHYHNIFFGEFKDSGLPAFATDGVQSRYRSSPSVEVARYVDVGSRGSNKQPEEMQAVQKVRRVRRSDTEPTTTRGSQRRYGENQRAVSTFGAGGLFRRH